MDQHASGIQEPPVVNCNGRAIHSFDDVCRMLGMSQQAPNGWKKLCVKPHLLCIACFSFWAANFSVGGILFGAGLPWLSPLVHPFYILATTFNAACFVWIWRSGPLAAKVPAFRILHAGYAAASVAMLVIPFVMRDYTPFSRPYMTVLGAGTYVWSAALVAVFGVSAGDHPHQPHKRLCPLLILSTFASMRVADIITDIGFARILMTQVPPCTWYGEPLLCSRFTHLGIFAALLAGVNIVLTFGVALLGGQAALSGGDGKQLWIVVATNAAIALLEVGAITVTLLKVFSDMRHPATGTADVARLRRDAAFGLVSASFTALGFCIGVLGMRRLLLALRTAAVSIRQRLSMSAPFASGIRVAPHLATAVASAYDHPPLVPP